MQFRKLAVAIGICALSSPVWAQSAGIGGSATGSAAANTATGVNETAGNSSAGVKAQGSGSADINSNRPSSPNRATGTDRVAPFVKQGAITTAAGNVWRVEHLYGIRPFTAAASMRTLQQELGSRVQPWLYSKTPY